MATATTIASLGSLPRPVREHLWACALGCGWSGRDPALSDAAFTRFNHATGVDERVPRVVELCPACGGDADPVALLAPANVVDHPMRERTEAIAKGEAAFFIEESEDRANVAESMGLANIAEFLRRNAQLIRKLAGIAS